MILVWVAFPRAVKILGLAKCLARFGLPATIGGWCMKNGRKNYFETKVYILFVDVDWIYLCPRAKAVRAAWKKSWSENGYLSHGSLKTGGTSLSTKGAKLSISQKLVRNTLSTGQPVMGCRNLLDVCLNGPKRGICTKSWPNVAVPLFPLWFAYTQNIDITVNTKT